MNDAQSIIDDPQSITRDTQRFIREYSGIARDSGDLLSRALFPPSLCFSAVRRALGL